MKLVPHWLTTERSPFWTATSRLVLILGLLVNLTTLLILVLTRGHSATEVILSTYVGILTIIFLVLLFRQQGEYHRKSQYGPAMVPFRKAFYSLAEASWNIFERNDTGRHVFHSRIKESLNYIAETFTLVTESSCRASIKLISFPISAEDANDARVTTWCRDNDGSTRHSRNQIDRVGDNTDFSQLLSENETYFFHNDLPKAISQGYKNSHSTAETIQNQSFEYRSTIVWPIGQRSYAGVDNTDEFEVIGFLCVDSMAVNSFNETYDVPL